jgi:spore germination protein GerM
MKQVLGLAIVVLLFLGIWAVFSSLSQNGEEASREVAETWITEKSPTYLFDGSDLRHTDSRETEEGEYEHTFEFSSSSAGYGDRSGETTAQVITEHTMVVGVRGSEVVSAVTDGVFDEITGEMLDGEEGEESDAETVTLYFYKVEEDTDEEGNILCSSDAVLPVERVIEDYTLEKHFEALLAGPNSTEEADGFSSEFPLEGLTLEAVEGPDSEGVLTLTLEDPEGATVGGSCRVGILSAQIIKTAETIDGVESVQILPEDLFQP